MLSEKRWRKEWEEEIAEEWKKGKRFAFNKNTSKKVYSIDTPPPYVNAPIHIGHATTYTLMDMFARFRRMIGYEVLFPLGLDRNGLPIEVATEKRFNIDPSKVSREEFLAKCKELLDDFSTKSADTFFKLGISFNSWDVGTDIGDLYLTDMEEYRALTQATFIKLWKEGLVYEDERINNYCPVLKTTIADSEIEYKEVDTFFNYIKFKVKETGEEIVVGTTRPELLRACKMIIFNPEDERYKHLEGKKAVVPIYGHEIPIKAHPFAKKDEGTGLVMMCSFGDYTDIRFFREQNLEPLILINEEGRMNEKAGFLEGLKVKEARERIIEELKNRELVVKQEKVRHKVPISERSKHPIEFIAMKEYYLKQLEFKEKMKELIKEINFYAPESREILERWIDNLSMDWPISRRRYYATEIPLWYCKKCGNVIVPEEGKYYQPWKDKAPVDKCPKCGSNEFVGETRVFDTWFDSSISPLFIAGYMRDEKFFNKIGERVTLRPQGKEIVRTWLYYTLLRCYQLIKKPIFEDVWIHYHILDEEGRKMSKSLGNVIDPQDIIKKYGAEPFRLWCAFEGNLHKGDFKISYERIEGAGKFLTKLWNVARFISNFKVVENREGIKLREVDYSFLNQLNYLISNTLKAYKKYDFHNPAIAIREFVWEDFASHYIEMVKNRAYNDGGRWSKEEQEAAFYVLHTTLKTILLLLYPIIPFITYKLYKEIYGKDITQASFPSEIESKTTGEFSKIKEFNSYVWKYKKDRGMSLKDSIAKVVLSKEVGMFKEDLMVMHNIQEVEENDLTKIME